MSVLINKWLRGGIFGLMIFLSGAAYCLCNFYDPDPNDDAPPVVTVEFHYLVSQRAVAGEKYASSRGRSLVHAAAGRQLNIRRAASTASQGAFKLSFKSSLLSVSLRC